GAVAIGRRSLGQFCKPLFRQPDPTSFGFNPLERANQIFPRAAGAGSVSLLAAAEPVVIKALRFAPWAAGGDSRQGALKRLVILDLLKVVANLLLIWMSRVALVERLKERLAGFLPIGGVFRLHQPSPVLE